MRFEERKEWLGIIRVIAVLGGCCGRVVEGFYSGIEVGVLVIRDGAGGNQRLGESRHEARRWRRWQFDLLWSCRCPGSDLLGMFSRRRAVFIVALRDDRRRRY